MSEADRLRRAAQPSGTRKRLSPKAARERALYEQQKATEPPPTGRQLADAAIQQVDEHADPDWKDEALSAVEWLCEQGRDFTTDDVWFWLVNNGTETTHEPRALGAIMRRAAKLGLCKPLGEWRQSTRPECHANPKRVWRPIAGKPAWQVGAAGAAVTVTWGDVEFPGFVTHQVAADVWAVRPAAEANRDLLRVHGCDAGWTLPAANIKDRKPDA